MKQTYKLPRVLSIPMSSVAALLGHNRYKSVVTENAVVLKRYNSGKKRTLQRTKQEFPLVRELEKNHNTFYKQYTESVKVKHLEQRSQKLLRKLCSQFDVPFFYHRSLLAKKRGYVLEKVVRAKFAKLHGAVIDQCQQKTVWCKLTDNVMYSEKPEGSCYRLVGKADGFVRDTNTVIEIKTRKNCFHSQYYETIQLCLYIIAYGCEEGILVQQYEGEIRTKSYHREQAMYIWQKEKKALDCWAIANA